MQREHAARLEFDKIKVCSCSLHHRLLSDLGTVVQSFNTNHAQILSPPALTGLVCAPWLLQDCGGCDSAGGGRGQAVEVGRCPPDGA